MTLLEDELAQEERALRAEQEWFLTTQVEPSLQGIQRALQACQEAVRLQEDARGSLTLAISSPNDDILKGFVTLAGSFIVKGELTVKLPKLPVVKVAIHSQVPSNASLPLPTIGTGATTSVPATSPDACWVPEPSVNTSGPAANEEDTVRTSAVAPPRVSLATAERTGSGSKSGEEVDPHVAVQGSHQFLQNALESLPRTISATNSGTATPPAGVVPQPPLNTLQLLHSYRPPGHLTQAYLLEQIKDVQNHTAQAIFRLEDYWNGDCIKLIHGLQNRHGESKDANQEPSSGSPAEKGVASARDIEEATRPLKTLLGLMQRHLRAGVEAMARPEKEKLYPFRVCDPKIFSPTLNEDFVLEFYIRDCQLVCAAYALQLAASSSPTTTTTAGATTTPGSSTSTSPGASSDSQHSSNHPPSSLHQPSTHLTSGDQGKTGQGTPGVPSSSHHPPGSNVGPPLGETVVLSSSSRVGQTTKGGVNKYRGKVATTIEDKVVQVQSSKLVEINSRLAHAEGLCRQLLNFLVLQESATSLTT
ncbi:hypothetical protein B0O80DRAFT_460027 [Mortierella sp. GBAus27b]|nr:hypothetical protein B0O80DRAFT_460027 [Mortierella sp. GBAus27b]